MKSGNLQLQKCATLPRLCLAPMLPLLLFVCVFVFVFFGLVWKVRPLDTHW